MLSGLASLARLVRGSKNINPGLTGITLPKHLRTKPRTNLSDLKNVLTKHITKENPIDIGSESRAMDVDPKYNMLDNTDWRSGQSIYRGRTLVDDPSQISTKKQMAVLRPGESHFTTDPIEAAHHGYASQSADNPAVILRMLMEDANTRTTRFGMTKPGGGHSIVSNEQQAHIPLLMNIIIRLKKMGWSDAHIFKYMKQLYKDPRPKKIFNTGGIVSLML
jgi:hypothetical protein